MLSDEKGIYPVSINIKAIKLVHHFLSFYSRNQAERGFIGERFRRVCVCFGTMNDFSNLCELPSLKSN